MDEGESITSHMSVEAKYGTIDPKSTPHLLAIEYPGFIKNVDKAIETLGGEESISQVRLVFPSVHWINYSSSTAVWKYSSHLSLLFLPANFAIHQAVNNNSKLLELRFRPWDPFCHPVYGDYIFTSNLLAKVSRKKRKLNKNSEKNNNNNNNNNTDSNSNPSTDETNPWRVDIVGLVHDTYRFQGIYCVSYISQQ